VKAASASAAAAKTKTAGIMAAVAAMLAVIPIAADAWLNVDRSVQASRRSDIAVASQPGRASDGAHDKAWSVAEAPRSSKVEPRRATTKAPALATSESIRGTVSSSNGSPLVGAEVCLTKSSSGLDTAPACTLSDASGAFRIAASPEGDLLVATAPAHESQVREVTASSTLAALDFVLGPARAASVSGVVVDAAGGPVPGALVLARGRGSEVVASASSDENGRFGLAVEPGHLTLGARAEAYAPASVEIEAPVDQVTLVLAATSTLMGVVVEDANEQPVADVLVSAYARGALHLTGLHVTTDTEGRFQLTGLHAGPYQLSAGGPEWGGGEATVTVGVAEVSAPIVLRVRAGTTLTGVIRAGGESCPGGGVSLLNKVSLGAEADAKGEVSIRGVVPGEYEVSVRCPHAVTLWDNIEIGAAPVHREWDLDTGATVRGRVERANGEPASASSVRMLPAPRSGAENERPGIIVECAAGDGNEFVCKGVEPGRYEFSLGNQAPITVGSIAVTNADREPAPVVLRMPPVASILVQIADGESSRPSSFHVLAQSASAPPLQAEPHPEGRLLRDVPLGSYAVYFGPTSRVPEAAPRAVLNADGEVVRVTLTAPAALDISGVVLDASGSPVPELWLHAESTTLDMQPLGVPALTNERGEFVLAGLIPGTYDVVNDGAESRRLVSSVSAGSRDLVLQLRQ
jgi:hypothetical protein